MLLFAGNGDQKKFTKNPRHFSMQDSQANSKKKSTESGQSNVVIKVNEGFQFIGLCGHSKYMIMKEGRGLATWLRHWSSAMG